MNKDYTSIPGLGTGRGRFQVGSRQRLYQAADHLLVIQSTGFTEDYRRIFYRDILSVVIRKSRRQVWISLILIIALVLICLLRNLYLPWILVGVFCTPFAILLVMNLLRGPACDCYLTTRVQTIAVPTPGRLDKVPLLLEFLQSKVPSLQGGTTLS